jgi:hypothetical protein
MYHRRTKTAALHRECIIWIDTAHVRVVFVTKSEGRTEIKSVRERSYSAVTKHSSDAWLYAAIDSVEHILREYGAPTDVTVLWSPEFAHTFIRSIARTYTKGEILTKKTLDALFTADEKALKTELSQKSEEPLVICDRRTVGLEIDGYAVEKLPRSKSSSVVISTLVSVCAKQVRDRMTNIIHKVVGAKIPVRHHASDAVVLLTARAVRGPIPSVIVSVGDETTTLAICDSKAIPRIIRHIKAGRESLDAAMADAFPQHTEALRTALLLGHRKGLLMSNLSDKIDSILETWARDMGLVIVKALEKMPHESAMGASAIILAPVIGQEVLCADITSRRQHIECETPAAFSDMIPGSYRARHGADILSALWGSIGGYDN